MINNTRDFLPQGTEVRLLLVGDEHPGRLCEVVYTDNTGICVRYPEGETMLAPWSEVIAVVIAE